MIVGGGTRGVVTAACYIARIYGVKSAMPMFKALKACPDAVVIKPDFAKYTAASRQVRALMNELTPLVQPLSIDEAVMDLAGTEALHGAPPAVVLARFASAVEQEVGVTVSIGLAANRLMAKIAAGRGKPRGFTVIDAEEAAALLAPEPVRLLPGHRRGPGAQAGDHRDHPARPVAGAARTATPCASSVMTGPPWFAGPAARTRAPSIPRAKPNRSAPRRHSTATCPPSPTWNGRSGGCARNWRGG